MSEAMDAFAETARDLARAGRDFLATEQGRRLRRGLATAMIVGAPLAGELPVIRRTALGRALRFAGAAALVVKGAEWLRDWDPNPPIGFSSEATARTREARGPSSPRTPSR